MCHEWPYGRVAAGCRRYIAWYRSTAQVVIATWRAAGSRPYVNVQCYLHFFEHDIRIDALNFKRNETFFNVGAATLLPATFRI